MTASFANTGPSDRSDQLFELRYRPGPAWNQGLGMAEQDLGAHVDYMKSLGRRGDLVTAAPYAEHSGGVALLWAADAAAAQAVASADPAVIAATMACDVRRVVPRGGAVDRNSAGQRRNEDVMRRLFVAVAARDASALEFYAPSVRIHEAASLPYGGDYAGTDGVVQHATNYRRHWDGLQGPAERDFDPQFFARGDEVAVFWRQRARHADGRAIDMPVASLYTLADGKITDSRMFHFDAAAIAAFLADDAGDAGDAGDRTVAAREAELNACLEAGQFRSALEQFFANDAELAEVGQPATVGKKANLMREGAFLQALATISARRLGGAVQGDTSFSEWRYEMTFKSGRSHGYEQVARRRWRDGLVVREDFFHADFPAWLVEEVQEVAARLAARRH